MPRSKFELYEKSVQSPETHVQWFDQVYREIRGRRAKRLREDFCGTFSIAATWVSMRQENRAEVLDLDAETLENGRKKQSRRLTASQMSRIRIRRRSVVSVSRPGADLVVACNFSFYVFKQRRQLLEYFRAVRRSLARDGLFVLEMSGGPGMIEPIRERKVIRKADGSWDFTYIWDQKSFDPISHDARYSIHFNLADGTRIEDAFTYDWRLWTIPEVRDALQEAGFEDVRVYWETDHGGRGTGEYAAAEKADNAWAWIAYLVSGARGVSG